MHRLDTRQSVLGRWDCALGWPRPRASAAWAMSFWGLFIRKKVTPFAAQGLTHFYGLVDRATDTHAAQGSGETTPRPIGERALSNPTSPSSRRRAPLSLTAGSQLLLSHLALSPSCRSPPPVGSARAAAATLCLSEWGSSPTSNPSAGDKSPVVVVVG
jgi:hypothetical protein